MQEQPCGTGALWARWRLACLLEGAHVLYAISGICAVAVLAIYWLYRTKNRQDMIAKRLEPRSFQKASDRLTQRIKDSNAPQETRRRQSQDFGRR